MRCPAVLSLGRVAVPGLVRTTGDEERLQNKREERRKRERRRRRKVKLQRATADLSSTWSRSQVGGAISAFSCLTLSVCVGLFVCLSYPMKRREAGSVCPTGAAVIRLPGLVRVVSSSSSCSSRLCLHENFKELAVAVISCYRYLFIF